MVVALLNLSATEGTCQGGGRLQVRTACCILLAMWMSQLPVWHAHRCEHREQLFWRGTCCEQMCQMCEGVHRRGSS